MDLTCRQAIPAPGSDLAAVRSSAVRDEERGGWLLSGQKTRTTRGASCTHLFGLFRSVHEALGAEFADQSPDSPASPARDDGPGRRDDRLRLISAR
jgi:hypothetical protein